MLAVKSADMGTDFREWFNRAIDGETVIVSNPAEENIVILSEREYNKMAKAKRNAEYLAKLDRAEEQVKNGQVVVKTMDELLAMEE